MELLCNKYEEMMFDFIDGELTKSQLDDFNNHLIECISCRNELERRIKTIKLIADSAYISKKNLQESVINSIKQIKRNKLRFRYGSTIAACIIAVVILTNFGFMYMFQNKINKFDKGTDSNYAENNLKTYGTENIKDDLNGEAPTTEESPPLMGIAGFEPDSENETLPEIPDRTLTSPESLNTESSEDMIIFNTQLYAPDYLGKVNMVIISEEAAFAEGIPIKDASNYKVYIFNYTNETAQLLKQMAVKNGSSVFDMQPIDENSYILYIYLTQS